MLCQSNCVTLSQPLIDTLARESGFARGGIAAVPPAGSAESLQERTRFEHWVSAGGAGEMEYLKRANEQGELLRTSVRTVFPWVQSVIVCTANYNSTQPHSLDPAPEGSAWIARYAWSGDAETQRPADYHKVLLKRLQSMEARLHETLGGFESRCYVDTGPLVERVYARYAGLGWTGKNTCLIDQKQGSWLFLGVILTSLELPTDGHPSMSADRCGSCTRCIDACPTQALTPYKMDASRCIAYLTIEKRGVIPHGNGADDLREGIGRHVFGCDICQDVCPWNAKSRSDKGLIAMDAELAPRKALVNPALDWLASMSPSDFGNWFYGSPVKRAKFEGFRRNIAIAMGNSGLSRFIPILEEWSHEADEGIVDAALWSLKKLHSGTRT
jgi:epoxyqueuosine reductase